MQKLTFTILALALGACHTTVVVNNIVVQAPEAITITHRPEPLPPPRTHPLSFRERVQLEFMRTLGTEFTKARPVHAEGTPDAPRVGGIRGYAPELAPELAQGRRAVEPEPPLEKPGPEPVQGVKSESENGSPDVLRIGGANEEVHVPAPEERAAQNKPAPVAQKSPAPWSQRWITKWVFMGLCCGTWAVVGFFWLFGYRPPKQAGVPTDTRFEAAWRWAGRDPLIASIVGGLIVAALVGLISLVV